MSPRNYDADPRTDEQIEKDDSESIDEKLDSVVGSLTKKEPPSYGNHPESVKQVWVGVRLPIRADGVPVFICAGSGQSSELVDRYFASPDEIKERGEILVDIDDALNALANNGASMEVLGYWKTFIQKNSWTRFVFDVSPSDELEIDPNFYDPDFDNPDLDRERRKQLLGWGAIFWGNGSVLRSEGPPLE